MWGVIKTAVWSAIKAALYLCALYALGACSLWLCSGAGAYTARAAVSIWALGSVVTGYYARRTGLLNASVFGWLVALGVCATLLAIVKGQASALSAGWLALFWIPSWLGWRLSAQAFFARKALPKNQR